MQHCCGGGRNVGIGLQSIIHVFSYRDLRKVNVKIVNHTAFKSDGGLIFTKFCSMLRII